MSKQLSDIAKVKFSPVDVDLVDLLSIERFSELWNAVVVARQICRFAKSEVTTRIRLLIEEEASPEDILEPFDNGIVTLENTLTFMKAARDRIVVGMAAACS